MPRTKTVKGQHCSPGNSGNGSCYTKSQLQIIIRALNVRNGTTLPTSGTKETLWNVIDQALSDSCSDEICWMSQVSGAGIYGAGAELESAFRPLAPADDNSGEPPWLSTDDIRNVLSQYEAVYPDFTFLGPFPMDFCQLANNEICNINFKQCKRRGKTRIGVVFNTDPSTAKGKHWVSMFIDLRGEPDTWEVNYFDSFGIAVLSPEVQHLINKFKEQCKNIKVYMNCSDKMCTTRVTHQRSNTECGVYSINFIVERLTGKSWEEFVVMERQKDEKMIGLRNVYFRPRNAQV